MLALIQRVKEASVKVDERIIGAIEQGLLVFLGIERDDTEADADKLLKKVLAYRIFADADDRMNLSVRDVNGGLLVISQFTLAAETDKGLRPSFSGAKPPDEAQLLYHYFLDAARSNYQQVAAGKFGADMQVALINDGPVTFLLRS